jgi:hypothetical protein
MFAFLSIASATYAKTFICAQFLTRWRASRQALAGTAKRQSFGQIGASRQPRVLPRLARRAIV